MKQIDGEGYTIKEKVYQNNSTYVAYPLIVSGADSKKQELWNSIILEDVNKILKIYSAYGLTPPSNEEDIFQSDTLRITYNIKRKDERYLSIFYTANFFSPYAAYPTELVYTTNIDMVHGRRMRLSDIMAEDSSLADNIISWDIVMEANDREIEGYTQAVHDYVSGLGRKILLMGFSSADIIGPDNYLGIYSYLTPDRIGISMSVPNYLGDHVEFEKYLTDI